MYNVYTYRGFTLLIIIIVYYRCHRRKLSLNEIRLTSQSRPLHFNTLCKYMHSSQKSNYVRWSNQFIPFAKSFCCFLVAAHSEKKL